MAEQKVETQATNGADPNSSGPPPSDNNDQKYDKKYKGKSKKVRQAAHKHIVQVTKHVGKTVGLEKHIFETYAEQTNTDKTQFQDTLKAIQTYVANKFQRHAMDLKCTFSNFTEPKITKPTSPETTKVPATGTDGKETGAMKEIIEPVDQAIFDAQVKNYVTRVSSMEQVVHALFEIVLSQCSPLTEEKLNNA